MSEVKDSSVPVEKELSEDDKLFEEFMSNEREPESAEDRKRFL